jgi:hypothetical protein
MPGPQNLIGQAYRPLIPADDYRPIPGRITESDMIAKSASAAVLIDGTAIYFRAREGRSEGERLDYEELSRYLRERAGVPNFDPAIFFTTYDAQNEGQAKFLSFVRNRLQWEPETRPVWDADPLPKDAPWERGERRNEFIRFDAPIAFALGRLVDRKELVIVVTDSFAVEQPMLAASAYGKATIVLAFFGQQLDPRWLPVVRGGDNRIEFWDLDEISDSLFGREAAPRRPARSALMQLR